MSKFSNDQLRIIDANTNRLGEGLRVLEEFARMTLNNTVLTQKLKNMRHKVLKSDAELYKKLIQSRDAAGDIGRSMDAEGENRRKDIKAIVTANARRAQESLRVLEEMAKIPELNLDSEKYRQARFELYTMEKELISRLLRKDKTERVKGLYVIIDTEWLKGRKPADAAGQAIKGGANVIQLRCKESNVKKFLDIAVELKKVCQEKNILFIVNDSLEIALAVKADGLNVGQEDMPANEARKLMPVDMILGCSANTVEEAKKAYIGGADYLGVGAIFATATKETSRATGLKIIGKIEKATDLPIVAIGGINRGNLKEVMAAGADAAAVISAVMGQEDIEKATRELVNIIGEYESGKSGRDSGKNKKRTNG